ncbi:DNA polymerase III subunit delta [Paraliobacillus sp. PM-2]|uniref:DNA polymerase III subunit delta n=1 Tax=Paraliobacillus sp. PM-2 TaxID=1462524 RepID=UPI00061C9EFD|nr:DNA polymerase III subunit delta [Paraliobacillus sp. PM-2]CQR46905.1 DNA polymerase III subunit delta [Paraliobacillus sp. PM-2]
MDYFKAINKIEKNEFQPIYLLYGTESYLIENMISKLKQHGLSDSDDEANFIRYDLEETAIQEVIMDVETYPFFGQRKVVLAYHPIFLTSKPDKSGVSHQIDALLKYVSNPIDYSILVLIAPYEKLDERKKITKVLKKQAEMIECHPVKEWDIDKWIDFLAKQLNVGIEKATYEVISKETGANLMLLEKELEKLATYVGKGGIITPKIAEELLAHQSTNNSGLKLVDAVIAKDLAKAIRVYQDLSRINEDEIALLALLGSQFRTINHVKILKKSGYSQKQMAQQLKVHPYVIKMAMTREKYFSREKLEAILDQCTLTDIQIKQGQMDKRLAFELLLYQIIKPFQ